MNKDLCRAVKTIDRMLLRTWAEQAVGPLSDTAFELLVHIAELLKHPAAREVLRGIVPRLDSITEAEFTAAIEAAEKAAAEA